MHRHLVLLVALAAPCTAAVPWTPHAGHLVIVGGGMDTGPRDPVLVRLGQLARPGPVGVLSTASGEPEVSGPEAVQDFDTLLGKGHATWLDAGAGPSTGLVDVRASRRVLPLRLVFFTGGDQARILAAFRPGGRETRTRTALCALLDRGGTIAGTSAGAAMMSDPMLRWGDSADALERGPQEQEDAGVGIGTGMGFFPFGLVDQHFLKRGRLGRLLVALSATRRRFGFAIDESRGVDVDLARGTVEALGEHALLLVDTGEAVTRGPRHEAVRLSLLAAGDTVVGATGHISPAAGTVPLPREPGHTCPPPHGNPWAPYAVRDAIQELARAGAASLVYRDTHVEVTYRADARTRFWRHPGLAVPYSASGVRVDLRRLDGRPFFTPR